MTARRPLLLPTQGQLGSTGPWEASAREQGTHGEPGRESGREALSSTSEPCCEHRLSTLPWGYPHPAMGPCLFSPALHSSIHMHTHTYTHWHTTPNAQRVRKLHNKNNYSLDSWIRMIHWNRKWQPTPAFLSVKFQGQRSWKGYSHGVAKSRIPLRDRAPIFEKSKTFI